MVGEGRGGTVMWAKFQQQILLGQFDELSEIPAGTCAGNGNIIRCAQHFPGELWKARCKIFKL